MQREEKHFVPKAQVYLFCRFKKKSGFAGQRQHLVVTEFTSERDSAYQIKTLGLASIQRIAHYRGVQDHQGLAACTR